MYTRLTGAGSSLEPMFVVIFQGILYQRETFHIVNLNCILYISDNVEMDEAVEAWTNRPFLFILIQNMQIHISVDSVEDMAGSSLSRTLAVVRDRGWEWPRATAGSRRPGWRGARLRCTVTLIYVRTSPLCPHQITTVPAQ